MIVIKLIALDLDGTLYNSERCITPKTREALLAVQQQGIRIVIASGRPLPGLYNAAAELQLADFGGYIIAYNGARAFDCANNQEIYKKCIPRITARALLQHLHYLLNFSGRIQRLFGTFDSAALLQQNKSRFDLMNADAALGRHGLRCFTTAFPLPFGNCHFAFDIGNMVG